MSRNLSRKEGDSLVLRSGQDIVKIILQEKEPARLYLVLEGLPAGVARHGRADRCHPRHDAAWSRVRHGHG